MWGASTWIMRPSNYVASPCWYSAPKVLQVANGSIVAVGPVTTRRRLFNFPFPLGTSISPGIPTVATYHQYESDCQR